MNAAPTGAGVSAALFQTPAGNGWKTRLGPYLAPWLRTAAMRAVLRRIAGSPSGHRWLNGLAGASGVFHSFPEAHRAAARLGLRGHDEPRQIEFYSHLFRQSDYPILYWLSRIAPRRLFDFGGAVGGLHSLYRSYLDDLDAIDWIVYDLPGVVAIAEQRVCRWRAATLRFTTGLSDLDGCDVFLASGSLHYWEAPLAGIFTGLQQKPRHVLINRSPMTDRESYVVVQRFPQVALASIIRNKAAVIEEFQRLGYTFVNEWVEPTRSLTIPLFPQYDVKAYTGLYFRLTNA